MMRLLFLTVSLIFAGASIAASCVKTGSVCVDSTPCKTVSGVSVCLTDPAINKTCWQYTDTYKCIKPNAVDYCSALSQTPGCYQTDSVCSLSDTSFGAGCMTWTNTWRCGTGLATPANTVSLGTSYTIASNTLDATACATSSSNPTCTLASHVCADSTPSKIIDGMTVTLAEAGGCWSYTDSYSCLGAMKSTCAELVAKGCTLDTSKCIKTGLGGACTLKENTYKCKIAAGSTSTTTDCGGSQYCTGGNCFDTGHVPDTDMAQTAAMMEAMRQAGNYMDGSMKIFSGQGSSCTNTLFGLFNCCKGSGGGSGMNNSSIMNSAMSAGGQVLKAGSSYMYDMMYDNSYVIRGIDSALSSTPIGSLVGGSSSFSPTLSMYGFTASWSASGGFVLTFNPTTLAIQVAIMIIVEIASCDPEEKMLALKKGQNLCRFTGSFCSVEVPIIGTCLQTTQTYCCFNSRLARIINTAGGAQIGRPATDCSGFTPAQFAALDFSRIDLSEFVAEIMANVHMPNTSAINTDSTATMQRKLDNYYTRGRQ